MGLREIAVRLDELVKAMDELYGEGNWEFRRQQGTYPCYIKVFDTVKQGRNFLSVADQLKGT